MSRVTHFKGIVLAGGRGTRLYPLTAVASKQLQPIYDKPMVYYPLTTLMLAGVREILLISDPDSLPSFRRLLGDGSRWGMSLSYAPQAEPRGIAEALIIGEEFLGDAASMLMLGDNLIYGRLDFLRQAQTRVDDGAVIFAYQVRDPSSYAVLEFSPGYQVLSLIEKPESPSSSWAVPGLYLYGPGVAERAKRLQPSPRGELEITDLNLMYLAEGKLRAFPMGRGIAWLDTGTPKNLLDASTFVQVVEERQGLRIGCPEEVAYRMGFIDRSGLVQAFQALPQSPYRQYLEKIWAEGDTSP